jgi:hypothetical protein
MPKGGELHDHLHSAVFAETLIRDAIEDKLCVDETAHSFAKRRWSAREDWCAERALFPPPMPIRICVFITD